MSDLCYPVTLLLDDSGCLSSAHLCGGHSKEHSNVYLCCSLDELSSRFLIKVRINTKPATLTLCDVKGSLNTSTN